MHFGIRCFQQGIYAILILFSFVLFACKSDNKKETKKLNKIVSVTAQVETKPVPRDTKSDAADDPAIWINFRSPEASRIIGTDKQGGLAVYNLSGEELYYYNTGKLNNADLRYHFRLGPDSVDILSVSNRTGQSVDIYLIDKDGQLQDIHTQLRSQLKEEVYGLCMYQSKKSGKFYVFVSAKDGEVEQWELFAADDKINGKIVRRLKPGAQLEGMVADDETGMLYLGEEDKGIWKYNAEPDGPEAGELISGSRQKNNQNIKFDIEGLAIYKQTGNKGYLIASSQGNDSYAVFDRTSPHRYLGSFKVVKGSTMDGTEETDGLDVVSFPVGPAYPHGLMVIQDGHNKDNGRDMPQNFKIVNWDSVAMKFDPPLSVHNQVSEIP